MNFTGFDFELETAEQIEARKLEAKRIAKIERQNADVIKQNKKAESNRCGKQVSNGTYSMHSHDCGAKAHTVRSMRINDWDRESPFANFVFCKRHDPILKAEKEKIQHDLETKARTEKWAREDRIAARQTLIGQAVGHLSNEKLVELAAFLQTQDGFKKEATNA